MKNSALKMMFAAAVVGLLLFGELAQAQRGGGGMSQRFSQNSPAVGERLPDVTAYDEDGNKFNLREIKDNYSVIVFGCLT